MLRIKTCLIASVLAGTMIAADAADAIDSARIPSWLHKSFEKAHPALRDGKFNLESRLRYEWADMQTLSPSHAPTFQSRLGFTTAPVAGFQTMVEGEWVQTIGDRENYALPGDGSGKTVIADPEVFQLNQAWLSYNTGATTLKGGRQFIIYDNARFVGHVAWRQNAQSFDAVSLLNESIKDLEFRYNYVWAVNRIFGDDSSLPPAFNDFNSDSHFIHAAYKGLPYGTLTGYTYLLDFDNSPANSTATFGASFVGSKKPSEDGYLSVGYRLEYARQIAYGAQPLNGYAADYFRAEASGEVKGITLGSGYELLGSDGGAKGFVTPIATAHAQNGWADAFLATPLAGLQDVFVYAGTTLPGNMPLKVIYHYFQTQSGRLDLGNEIDVLLTRKFGSNWLGILKYAYLDGKGAIADRQRLWVEINFKY
jgi:hypothetical protein